MPTKSHTSLVVMTKFPEAGKVKTRLSGVLGKQGACRLHAAMVQHLRTQTLSSLEEIEVQFYVAGGDQTSVSDWLGEQAWVPQVEGDLGIKMKTAIQSCFDQGAPKVLILGTDIPSLSSQHILRMEDALDHCDVAFNPALDGGYVMAGMCGLYPEMFEGFEWSTEQVLTHSVKQLEAAGKRVSLLESLPDVDTEEDLELAVEILGYKPWES